MAVKPESGSGPTQTRIYRFSEQSSLYFYFSPAFPYFANEFSLVVKDRFK